MKAMPLEFHSKSDSYTAAFVQHPGQSRHQKNEFYRDMTLSSGVIRGSSDNDLCGDPWGRTSPNFSYPVPKRPLSLSPTRQDIPRNPLAPSDIGPSSSVPIRSTGDRLVSLDEAPSGAYNPDISDMSPSVKRKAHEELKSILWHSDSMSNNRSLFSKFTEDSEDSVSRHLEYPSPPARAGNPLVYDSRFADEDDVRKRPVGAELGLLSFSPPLQE